MFRALLKLIWGIRWIPRPSPIQGQLAAPDRYPLGTRRYLTNVAGPRHSTWVTRPSPLPGQEATEPGLSAEQPPQIFSWSTNGKAWSTNGKLWVTDRVTEDA